MATARIFRQPKNAMQSGMANTHEWVVEFEKIDRPGADPLMGWIGSADTQKQVRLRFDSMDEAVAYAQRNGLPYLTELPHERILKPKAYADNFKYGRSENWTH